MENKKQNNKECAKIFCDAIRTFAERPENLENLENYLSIHFDRWISKWANTPEDIAQEMRDFATIEM